MSDMVDLHGQHFRLADGMLVLKQRQFHIIGPTSSHTTLPVDPPSSNTTMGGGHCAYPCMSFALFSLSHA